LSTVHQLMAFLFELKSHSITVKTAIPNKVRRIIM
jgi:hypothetical protein